MPSGSLPPLSSTDRRSDGRRIGPCPACGGHQWWDNRAAKRAAQATAGSPDFRCVACRHALWERAGTDHPGWEPTATTTLPTAGPDAMRDAGPARRCTARRADGQRCRNGAMKGGDRCGPHAAAAAAARTAAPASDAGPGRTEVPESSSHGVRADNACLGVTKAGRPCRAGAQRGSDFCPAHADQAQ